MALHHLSTFGAFQSWSGYFTATAKGAFAGARPAELDANSPAAYVPRLAPAVRRLGLRAFLYQGVGQRSGTGAIRAFAARLRAAGARVGLGLYAGARLGPLAPPAAAHAAAGQPVVRDARAPGDRTAGAVTRADRTAPWRVASALVTARPPR